MKQVVIIGGGAAGLMAAISAAQQGAKVIIIEKMSTVGRKLLITGKGRCNITNNAEIPELIKNMPGNGSFLYSAFYAFNNQDVVRFFEDNGLPTKVERGGRVFPVSDKAADVVGIFKRVLDRLNVQIKTGQRVEQILTEHEKVSGVTTVSGDVYDAQSVIIATGGASYPTTGSTGDGYELAKRLGHAITPLKGSLVPLEVAEDWIIDLQGLSLKNVSASLYQNGKVIAEDFGEMLFTHFGLSGPIILSLSKKAADLLESKKEEVLIRINLKPALTPEVLDKRIQRDFEKHARKQLKNSLGDLLPAKLISCIIDLSFIDPDKFVHQITKTERLRLIEVIRNLTFTITRTRPLSEAIITQGGVNIKEINPATMESKILKGLYFAGEVIDIDGYTGGYNLQAAFSTGHLAGKSSAAEF